MKRPDVAEITGLPWPRELAATPSDLAHLPHEYLEERLADLTVRGVLTEDGAERIRQLRRGVIDATRRASAEDVAVRDFATAETMLLGDASGRVPARLGSLRGRWVNYALTPDRMRIPEPRDDGGPQRYRKTVTRYLPWRSELPTIPPGGVVLVVYGGGPEVLDYADVPDKLRLLTAEAPVADVLLHDTGATPPTVHTLRWAGTGHGASLGGRDVPDDLPWAPKRPT